MKLSDHLKNEELERLNNAWRYLTPLQRKALLLQIIPYVALHKLNNHIEQRQRSFVIAPTALWYATLSRDGMTLTATERAFAKRHTVVEDDVRLICHKAGVPYLSPHKLRHGHTVYALKRAGTVAQLKAVSQNIMHESLVTTDQIYGRLVHDDVREIIGSL